MKIFISAAEASSDAHGAELLKALRAELPADETLDAFGIGGPKLQAAGLRAIADARDLLSMGFVEVLGRLPRILKILGIVSQELKRNRPDVAVVIDYPEFHLRLAKTLSHLKIPAIYYIPPKLWVWRKQRLKLLKDLFTRVLCIFPFEVEFYQREGLAVKYVGNPLLDELALDSPREAARQSLGLRSNDPVLAILPGSRPSELAQHLQLMIDAANLTALKLKKSGVLEPPRVLQVLLPLPETADLDEVRSQIDSNARETEGSGIALIDLRLSRGDSAQCLKAADAALVKSGTSTLEAALLGCPHAVIYRTNRLTAWLYRRVVRYRGPVGLVNLILKNDLDAPVRVAREILLEDVTPENLACEAVRLLTDQAVRTVMASKFHQIREQLSPAGIESPSAAAARELMEVVRCSTH